LAKTPRREDAEEEEQKSDLEERDGDEIQQFIDPEQL